LGFKLGHLQRFGAGQSQGVTVKGFGDKIESPLFDCRDSQVDRTVGGDDNNRSIRRFLFDGSQNLQAVQVAQFDVGYDEIRRSRAEPGQSLLTGGGLNHIKAGGFKIVLRHP